MNGLREAKHGLSRSNRAVREPRFTLRATDRRPPKRNHGRTNAGFCPLAWKNMLEKAML